MASGPSDASVVISDPTDNREVNPLKLGAEHLPFPCSLRELVIDRYAVPDSSDSNATAMQVEELLEYLKTVDHRTLSPLDAVVKQTELIGDPAAPSREHAASLKWLGNALALWEKAFPLEEPLADDIRRLVPLAASLAILDPYFLQPGAHPLHQLLDKIQDSAIGWQSRLDRVGTMRQRQITTAIDRSLEWFENQSSDLASICTEFSVSAERDQSRSQRMVQRVVETELGKVKTAAAKNEAARMINTALDAYPIPEDIGEFLKGPWYSSAQLLLLKFGVDSEQWEKMSATTEALLDSLKSLEGAEESRRQHIFEAVTQLPKEMRRWLLSLHHDTEAVNEAIGLVEFAHLRILRGQPLELGQIEPIVADDKNAKAEELQHFSTMQQWHKGQWFNVNNGDEGVLRAQLALKVEHSQQLFFTNMAGIKVLQLSFAQFVELIEKKKASPLYSGGSFSLCLASAVGIESTALLDALVNIEGVTERESKSQHRRKPDSDAAPNPVGGSPGEEDEPVAQNEDPPEVEPPSIPRGRYLIDQAEEIKKQGGYLPRQAEDNSPVALPLDEAAEIGFSSEQASAAEKESAPLSNSQGGVISGESQPAGPDNAQKRHINLSMGTWLGFHDGEAPLMAKLAAHDLEGDFYIFVNRKGVKMRQLTKLKLLDLIDRGMIDILETSSNFRKKVTEVRKNLDQ